MYLGHKKVKAKSFVSGFVGVPPKLGAVRCVELVQRLQKGDNTVKEELILGHLGLTIQIVGRYVSYMPRKSEDLMGVGQLALCEAIDKFQKCGKDTNITPFIVTTIHGQLANFVDQDHTVMPTVYGVYQKVKEARVEKTKVNMPMFCTFESPDEEQHILKAIEGNEDRSHLHIENIMKKVSLTRFEADVFRLLMLGFKEADVARKLQASTVRVNKTKFKLRELLAPYFGEENLKATIDEIFKSQRQFKIK